jgi:hypothetical protein
MPPKSGTERLWYNIYMSFNFASFSEGVGFATAAIVAFEILKDYAIGDVVKDFFLKLFGKAKAEEAAVASDIKKKL